MPVPSPPAPGFASIGGLQYQLDAAQSGDWGSLNFPNPPAYEIVYDGFFQVGIFRWGASYHLGPAGYLELTSFVTHRTYSLDVGTHRLVAYGIASNPPYYEDNADDPWPGIAGLFHVTMQEFKIWSGDWRIKVIVSDPYEGNYQYYLSINDPAVHEIVSWGNRQSWSLVME